MVRRALSVPGWEGEGVGVLRRVSESDGLAD